MNIQAFDTAPRQQFEEVANWTIIQDLRNGNGPVNALRNAVRTSRNTDLYVLFNLYDAARVAFLNVNNPNQQNNNEAAIQELEQQRHIYMRIDDELSGAYRSFDRQETNAAKKTWMSRLLTGGVGAAVALVMSGAKLPSVSTAGLTQSPPAAVNVVVNVAPTISLGHAITTTPDGSMIVKPANANDATEIKGSFFQLKDVKVAANGTISGRMLYIASGAAATRNEMDVKNGENTLPDGKKVTLERSSDGKLKLTFEGVSVNY